MLLLSLVSAKAELTSRTVDDSDEENNNEEVCCKIEAVVPEPVPSYELTERSECDNVGDNGEEIAGANKEIVDDSYCESDESNDDSEDDDETGLENDDEPEDEDEDADELTRRERIKEKIRNAVKGKNRLRAQIAAGECPEKCICSGSVTKCKFGDGTREMTIVAGKSGNIIVQVKGVNASTKVVLYKSDDGELYGVFRGNKTKIVKMLPNQVKEKIRERLARQLEDEEIELDEDGEYKYQGRERARLFAVFPVKVRVAVELDPETGEVIKLRRAWWAFMAKSEGDEIVGASCGTVSPDSRDECCINKDYDAYNEETGECEFSEEE